MLIKFNENLFKHLESLSAILLFILTGVAFIQLVLRYSFRISYAGVDELRRLAFVWIASVGSALAFRKKAHMGITYLANKMSNKNKLYLEIFVNIALIVFMSSVLKAGIHMAKMGNNQVSEYLQMSMIFFYLSIPFGAVLSILVFIEDLIKCIHNRVVVEK